MSLDDRNAALNEKLEKNPIDEQIESLILADKHLKNHVRWLVLTLILDVLLTIGFGYITIRTHQIATQADTNKAALIRACETANESRANNQKLWDYILEIPPTMPQTPEQLKQKAAFQDFVGKTFAQKDCQNEVKQ